MKRADGTMRRWTAILFFLAVIAMLSTFMGRTEIVRYTFSDDGFTVSAASGLSRSIAWKEINSLTILSEFDAGRLIDGVEKDQERSGIWENETYGRYWLCIDASIHQWIALSLQEETAVINFESNDSTQRLYQALIEATSGTNK